MDRFNMDVLFMVGRDIPAVIRISMAFIAPLSVLVRKIHLFLPIRFAVLFEKLDFYFMKTAKIPVYGNVALSVFKIDYIPRIHVFSILLIIRHRFSLRSRPSSS